MEKERSGQIVSTVHGFRMEFILHAVFSILNEELLKRNSRNTFWTNAIAVGDEGWLKQIAPEMEVKRYKIVVHEDDAEIPKINYLGGALLFQGCS